MAEQKITELEDVIKKLVAYGEDAAELDFWRKIYDSLSPKKQEGLLDNLNAELNRLETTGPKR
jgi:hypothetical protein